MESYRRWRARDDARNIAREYWVFMSTDLFGWVVVEAGWARIGTQGASRRRAFAQTEDALRFAGTIAQRRATAKQRIGVTYVPCSPEGEYRGHTAN